jgi:hypothetical protein
MLASLRSLCTSSYHRSTGTGTVWIEGRYLLNTGSSYSNLAVNTYIIHTARYPPPGSVVVDYEVVSSR